MCGRFILTASPDVLADMLDVQMAPAMAAWQPRYNIAPTQPVLAFRRNTTSQGHEATRLTWGLVPSWSKDPQIASRLINARSETAASKPSFRGAFRHRRCVIAADGYYEWQREGKEKTPFCIRRRDRSIFAIAGLWEHWQDPDGSVIESCALLTTTPNGVMAPIHDRMPVILDNQDVRVWINGDGRQLEGLHALLRPAADDVLEAFPVDGSVGNSANDGPECCLPVRLVGQQGLPGV